MKAVRLLAAVLYFIIMITLASTIEGRLDATEKEEPNPLKIVGYFPRWGVYSKYFVKNVVTSGSARVLTHLDYAFANVVNNRCVSFDPWADYQAPFKAEHA